MRIRFYQTADEDWTIFLKKKRLRSSDKTRSIRRWKSAKDKQDLNKKYHRVLKNPNLDIIKSRYTLHYRIMEVLGDEIELLTSFEERILAKENIELIIADDNDVQQEFLDNNSMVFRNIYKCLRCELTFENENQLHNCVPLPLNVNKQKKLKRVFKCTLCDKHYLFPSLATLHLKRHEKYMHSKLVNNCYICNSKFQTAKELKDHFEHVHNIIQYQCNICDKLFKQPRNLQYHIMSHSGYKPYKCELCGHKFTRGDHLARHQRDNCDQMEFECDLCEKIYNTKRGIRTHLKVHYDSPKPGTILALYTESGEKYYECTLCSKTFTQFSRFKEHIRTHTGEKPFECQICNKKFTCHYKLKMHGDVHKEERPFKCSYCDLHFKNKRYLSKHMRKHDNNKWYQCQICNKGFQWYNSLKYHVASHKGEKPYVCVECNKSYAHLSTLVAHQRTHSGQSNHVCHICNKKFSLSSSLKNHLITHSVEKPFKCHLCPAQATTCASLKSHLNTHGGDYQCSFCGGTFNQLCNLRWHERKIHRKTDFYDCEFCEMKFGSKLQLKNHLKLKHKIQITKNITDHNHSIVHQVF
ncbi:Zinc finger C2H2-type,Zinc finger, RING/FYVE/PHD-type [Cinara cedri]|uniref:Zinc finger C2H2-type,Zinc finger, RING/FYVE/PHD-type n=2 Tax=Cinara cedri TaxID=506608 RepID=A0A5E4NFD0_9HEMI|nr:Zinc finger C2H2-type,Zinc finger, RING/FYVE/PHD-type [Cinara cedri]